jgi:hypothetical protein
MIAAIMVDKKTGRVRFLEHGPFFYLNRERINQ